MADEIQITEVTTEVTKENLYETVGGYLEDLENYTNDGNKKENYIIKADHIKNIIEYIRKIHEYIDDPNENGSVTDNYGNNNEYIGIDIDNTSQNIVLKTFKKALNDLVAALKGNSRDVLNIDLSGENTNLTSLLKSTHIKLSTDKDGLNANNIPYNEDMSIVDWVAKHIEDFNDFTDNRTVHQKFIMKDYQTYNSIIIPAQEILNNSNFGTKKTERCVDFECPHSYDTALRCPCSKNEIDKETAILLEKQFAYGCYDLSARMRITDIDSSSSPVIVIRIYSENEIVGTWNIYPQKMEEKYFNINIPFKHNGVNKNKDFDINKAIRVEIDVNGIYRKSDSEYVYFDYVSINPTTTATYNEFVPGNNKTWEMK